MAEMIPAPGTRTPMTAEAQVAMAYEVTQLDLDRANRLEAIGRQYNVLDVLTDEINALRDPDRYQIRLDQIQARTTLIKQ